MRIAAATAAAGRTSASRHANAAPTASAHSVIATPAIVGTQPTAAMIDGRSTSTAIASSSSRTLPKRPSGVSSFAASAGRTARSDGAQRHREQLGKEDLAPDVERRHREVGGEDPVEDRDEAGTVSTASITIARCSAGANARLPPASSARRSATGAPGEIAIRTMPTATGPFSANDLERQHRDHGHRDDDREDHGRQHDAPFQRRRDLLAPEHQADART